ncbi:MAG: hypothetical protein V8R61_08285 [Enterocloster sp.]
MFDLIEETRNNGKHLFVLGNGGSAAAACIGYVILAKELTEEIPNA